jgi:hypothetical protein
MSLTAVDDLRQKYTTLRDVFKKNNLDAVPFTERLRGETNLVNIRDGIHAMRNFLIASGCLEDDPYVKRIPADNRPEYDLACRESAEDYLNGVSPRKTERFDAGTSRRSAPVAKSSPPSSRPNMSVGVANPVADKFYMVGDVPMQTVLGRNGHLYARRRSPSGRWEYVKGAIYAIRERGRVASVADIAAYGLASGVCFVCGRRLSDPDSVKAGIGPVCAKRVGR